VNQWNLGDAELFPFFEAAQDLGCALMIHPWDMMGKAEMEQYWLPWLVGMPAETTRAICSMIFGGVFERLPGLRVYFSHGGGAFAFTLGRIEHGFNVRPDLVAVDNPRNPRDYVGRFWVDSIFHDPKAFHFALDLFGAERIMMGSDYPFPLGELEPGKMISELESIDEPTRQTLLADAALDWLQLDPAPFADS